MNIQRLRNLTTGILHTEMGHTEMGHTEMGHTEMGHTEMGHIYEDLGLITGETGLMTHMLPRAMRAVEPWLHARSGFRPTTKICQPMSETQSSENGRAIGLAVESWFGVLTLNQLREEIERRFGDGFEITQRQHGDGSSEAVLHVAGALRASWRGKLKNAPVFDGETPRGPKEYYELNFFLPNIVHEPHRGTPSPTE